MEEQKILKPGKRRTPDVNDSTVESSPVSFGYDSVESGTPRSSISLDSNANLTAAETLLKKPHVDVTDSCLMSLDTVMSSR